MAPPKVLRARLVAFNFVRFVVLRFLGDDGFRLAAGLSYTSLLALVPLIAIALAILAAFPAFDAARDQLREAAYAIFPPGSGVDIGDYYDEFLENASRLTGPGVIGLALTAVLLLSNIDAVLSKIFREAQPRSATLRFLIYWAMLTLGPMLIGASFSLSSYVYALAQMELVGGLTGGAIVASRFVAIILATLGFGVIYLVVPHRRVAVRHALAGGLAAALLLELLKYSFGLYIVNFPTYEALYGALAALPIFLLWLYLAWTVVLLGAETAAALPEWRYSDSPSAILMDPGEKLALGLAVLERLKAAGEEGRRLSQGRLHRGLPATPAEVDLLISQLRKAGILERANRSRILLARDLRHLSFGDLQQALKIEPSPKRRWPGAAGRAAQRWADHSRDLAVISVAEVLEAMDEDSQPPEDAEDR
ncbi:YihY family inner membrane protein [Algihabitans albus]|uniref:YihY family inner membrane protein n=1 Tax=Algihabitans albus TaxID=2164067 RepID=UPI0013C32305|nr:YihY family inner membrane protein [Algihabitans albus]